MIEMKIRKGTFETNSSSTHSIALLNERYNCKDFNNDVNKMFSFLLKNT